MEGTIGEIRIFAGIFAPKGWAFCQGQLLSIDSYTALFSVVGTFYGGDGRNNFGLPDMRGRAVLGLDKGPGLSYYGLGARGGTEEVHLSLLEIPVHGHAASGNYTPLSRVGAGDETNPANGYMANANSDLYADSGTVPMGPAPVNIMVSPTGGDQGHENRQPFMALNFIICLEGYYPNRS